MALSRRTFLGATLGAGGLGGLAGASPAQAESFSFDLIEERAAALAREPYRPPPDRLRGALADLDRGAYRRIRFRPERALWRDRDLPFRVQFFHPGFLYRHAVAVNVVTDGQARPVAFDPTAFDYGDHTPDPALLDDLGYAGFRLHYPIHRADAYDEIAVFLGASYFRAVGAGQVYGLSARGLAVNTALPEPEEFPAFREFWLVEPAPDALALTLYAMLDGPSVTGAYDFVVHPGAETVIHVRSRLFARRRIERLGIAPLTSMFLFGENTVGRPDDVRPEVHDSDGMQFANGDGEWVWRPLRNPSDLALSVYAARSPRGFGLLQRDRDFGSYQDLETRPHRRPSVWVEPHGDWGRGAVMIIEIPSDSETNDNVVLLWLPAEPTDAGASPRFEYRLRFMGDADSLSPLGKVVSTREGAPLDPNNVTEQARLLVVEFAGGMLRGLGPAAEVEPVQWTSAGELGPPVARHNPETGGWRALLTLIPEGDGPIELRCHLRRGGDAVTETWSYQWTR